MTLMESIDGINSYIDNLCAIYEDYNIVYNILQYSLNSHGFIYEEVETSMFQRLNEVRDYYIFEAQKDFEDFLKDHDYNPQNKTIKYDNRRVKLTDVKGVLSDILHVPASKISDKDATNLTMGSPAIAGRGVKDKKMPAEQAKKYFDKPAALRRLNGIGIDKDALSKMSRKDIEYVIGHEYGHIKDYADERRAQRAPSHYFHKYSWATIPENMRSEFIKWEKKAKSGSLTKDELLKAQAFFTKLDDTLKSSERYKNDKDFTHADKYAKSRDDATKSVEKHVNPANPHDYNYREIKADAEGVRQAKKYTGDTPNIPKVLTVANYHSSKAALKNQYNVPEGSKLYRASVVGAKAGIQDTINRKNAVNDYIQNHNTKD